MAVSGADDSYLLPCGRDVAILWEHVAAGTLDEHEETCPHCQAAAAGFRALRDATGTLADLDVAPPRDLTERIMRAVRVERRRDRWITVADTGAGPICLAVQAAAVIVRSAADEVDGVAARACLIEPVPAAPVPDDDAEQSRRYRVRLEVALRYGVDGTAAIGRVRDLVRTAARDQAGFDAAQVDLAVVDVWQEV